MVKIRFYFPDAGKLKSKREIVRSLMQAMRKDGGIKYAGYLKESELQKDLSRHIGARGLSRYKPPSAKQRQIIGKDILSAIKKCHQILPHPDLPTFVFIYSWFPDKQERIQFEGISALAAYYTIHLFIDLDSYAPLSLRKTIAHEWNHLVFYRYNPGPRYTLGAHMLMEGLAELFREEVMGGKPAPWALALSRAEAQKQASALKRKLDAKGPEIYRQVFFGSKKYKRWTGYSVGYRAVKEFRKKHPKLSWERMIKIRPDNVLEEFIKNGA